MTVVELIAMLKPLPQDWTVELAGPEDSDGVGDVFADFNLQWGGGEVLIFPHADDASEP